VHDTGALIDDNYFSMSIVSPDVGLIDMPGNVIQATELERHYRIDQRAFYFDLEVTHFAYISTDLLQLS